jgi:uncharacterized repeat protein (TIGR03803 family)
MNNTQHPYSWNSKRSLSRAGTSPALAAVLALIGTAHSARAQTQTTVETFDGANGAYPYAGLIQATDGNFYGTTYGGGAHEGGTVYRVTPGGVATTLYSFCSQANCTDGTQPTAGLVQASDGDFYGTTYAGGASGRGTVFKVTANGTLTTLHSFAGRDGAYPYAGLIQAANGDLYGTALGGGTGGHGVVFRITRSGTLTTVHSFNVTDGAAPYGGLVQATNGNLYGTTYGGGANSVGTVFMIAGGTLTTLHSFDDTDGAYPAAGLVQAADGNLFGTTFAGGASAVGTVFYMTPGGALTTLHSFDASDGAHSRAGLIQASDGNLYGTTLGGGELEYGTIFRITEGGALTTLHDSCSLFLCADGALTYGALIQATNGQLYGTTRLGGAKDDNEVDLGTVFSLSVGLVP